MSEQTQHDGTNLQLRPQQNGQVPQTGEIIVDDSGGQPTYANFCRVTATPEEVILDFGLNTQPFTTGNQLVKANHRIVMSVYTIKRLLAAIGTSIQRHEQTFGPIETDVNRRASASSQRQFGPASAVSPASHPEVIRLS